MGADIKVSVESGAVSAALAMIQHAKIPELMDKVGKLVVRQTRNRIEFQKTSPDGARWRRWSKAYAARQKGKGSLLLQSHDLKNSIEADVRGKEVEVGSHLPYARIHQKGSKRRGIEKRPYLGISKENEREIREEIAKFMRGLIK